MARYDVYLSPSGTGYVLDVQADLLDGLNTRIVVPLMPTGSAPAPARRLNPVIEVASTPHVMVTQFLAAVPRAALGEPVLTLSDHDVEISRAEPDLTESRGIPKSARS